MPVTTAYFLTSSVIFMLQKGTAHRASSFAKASIFAEKYDVSRRRDRESREESHGLNGKLHDNDGFAALAQLESA